MSSGFYMGEEEFTMWEIFQILKGCLEDVSTVVKMPTIVSNKLKTSKRYFIN